MVVTSRRPLALRGVGDSAGRVTAVGIMRCSFVDPSSGRVSTVDLPNVHVCPSSGCFLLGNDARRAGVFFNGETGHVRVRDDNGVSSFPAELDNDLWRLPVVIHKPNGRLAFGSSPVAKAFNKAVEAPPPRPCAGRVPGPRERWPPHHGRVLWWLRLLLTRHARVVPHTRVLRLVQ